MTDRSEELEAGLLTLVVEVISELHPGRPVPELDRDTDLEAEAGLDSLGRVELMLRVEKRFGVSVPDEEAVGAKTPADLIRALQERGAKPVAVSTEPEARESAPTAAAAEPKQAGTLPEVLDWHANRAGERRCLTLFDDSGQGPGLDHEALRRGAAEVAAGLRERGIGPDDTVALMLPTGLDFFFAFHGVMWAGAVPVPLYPPVRASQLEDHLRRIGGVLENAGTRCFIASRETVRAGQLLRGLAAALDHVVTVPALRRGVAPADRVPRKSDDLAFLQYTSGTTGQPKGVMLTHGNLLANIRSMGQVVEASSDDHFVSWLPLYHDMGLIGACLGTLYYSIPLTLMSPLQFMARPQRWLWAIHRHRATLSAAPNFAYDLCARRLADEDVEGLDLSSWRVAFNGAEPVSPGTLESFCERFGPHGFSRRTMSPVYGLAESSVGLSFPPLDRGPWVDRVKRDTFERRGKAVPANSDDPHPRLFVACGKALPGHELRVVDDKGKPVADRVQGRLEFRGPSCTRGYFQNPAASEKLFSDDGWLDSGDLAYLDRGELFLTGRVKDLIIRGGRNYYPYEIEQAVSQIPGIRSNNVAVFASPDPDTGTERLVVVAETRETAQERLKELEQAVRDASLELLETPPEVISLVPPQSVPKTSSGKIRRPACRALFEQGRLGQRHRLGAQLLRLLGRGLPQLMRRGARRVGRGLFNLWLWLLVLIFALPLAVIMTLLPGRRLRAAVSRFGAGMLGLLSGAGPVVSGRENLPDGPCVVVCNHASYLDGFGLRAALPGSLVFVVKREIVRNPPLWWLLRRAGATPVERFDYRRSLADLEQAMARMASGERLMFFPEGTLTRAPGLQAFRVGAFMAAVRKGVPVVPVSIRGSRDMLRGFSFFVRPGRVSVTVGKPIHPDGDDWDAALKLRDQARDWILEHCGEPDLGTHTSSLMDLRKNIGL
ncbi:AMP-binding protein [Gammaproteobacteria bacterium AB-CW1]|uniref:AMP-binding protein n=1 Tax=Natronospira elongata TaxID=3110268 RepID=A0AAP6MK73_9GAMM|nr:AMP-binding protein [Gammaproteobacteria bacterium AB-CW1]MEA5446289.1 AMP-binding protein [Gammaproteobacteria bacterium AB-CW1]